MLNYMVNSISEILGIDFELREIWERQSEKISQNSEFSSTS